MEKFGYLFEARGIQRFLFATGKLKDMIDGSELIDFICTPDGYLDQVLKALDLQPQKVRCAGGVFYLVFNQRADAQRMQNAWRMAAARWLPTVECVDALSIGRGVREVIQAGLFMLAQNRNLIQADLPAASPVTARSPRTGLAAVGREHGESLDAATMAIRQFQRPAGSETVVDRFSTSSEMHWPNNFEADANRQSSFPLGQRKLIGLIHADGNNLGVLLRVLNNACQHVIDDVYVDLYRTFSEGVTRATVDAAKAAFDFCIKDHAQDNVLPARPLVLGGDDLSLIVRADLAVGFTSKFLAEFKTCSTREMTHLKAKFVQHGIGQDSAKLPDYLTACAGIVYVKASQPFYSAYAIAEALCSRAKDAAKLLQTETQIVPSALSFYKVSDSLLNGLDSMLAQTQIVRHVVDNQACYFHLGLPCYGIDQDETDKLAQIEDLNQLKALLLNPDNGLNDRGLRELATLLYSNLHLARQAYKRWLQHADNQVQSTKSASTGSGTQAFKKQLSKLIGPQPLLSDLPIALKNDEKEQYQTVLSDVLALLVVDKEVPYGQLIEGDK